MYGVSKKTPPVFALRPSTAYYMYNWDTMLSNWQLRRLLFLSLTTCLLFFLLVIAHRSFWTEPEAPDRFPHVPKEDGPNRPKFFRWDTVSHFRPVSSAFHNETTTKDLCASFPQRLVNELVQPVLRTGYFDIPARIQTQFASISACVDDLLIFSDVDDTIAGHPVYDVLADLPASYRMGNPEFANYTRMHELYDRGTLRKGDARAYRLDGWVMDKFKFLPMVERAWAMRPHKPWYFFYESDTYVVWDNLFRFLENLDANTPFYIGSPAPGGLKNNEKSQFAYGGSGFILSQAAMLKLLHRQVGRDGDYIEVPLSQRWEDRVRHDCCGDAVLGWALLHVGIRVSGFWPMINPYPLDRIPYSSGHWCQPVLTLHKTDPEEMVKLWRWEQSRRERSVGSTLCSEPSRGWSLLTGCFQTPLLFRHLFERTRAEWKSLDRERANWDNGGRGEYQRTQAGSSLECRKSCQLDAQCFQYKLDRGTCVLREAFDLGSATIAEDVEGTVGSSGESRGSPSLQTKVVSGWNMDHIDAWAREHTCDEVQWVRPSVARMY